MARNHALLVRDEHANGAGAAIGADHRGSRGISGLVDADPERLETGADRPPDGRGALAAAYTNLGFVLSRLGRSPDSR